MYNMNKYDEEQIQNNISSGSYSVVVITWDFESQNSGSNPDRSFQCCNGIAQSMRFE